MILFHITRERLVKSILRDGLKDTKLGSISLTQKKYLKDWMDSALLDAFESNSRGKLAVLRVSIPRSYVREEESDIAPEWHVMFNNVPPRFISDTDIRRSITEVNTWVIDFNGKLVYPQRGRHFSRTGRFSPEPKVKQFAKR